MKTIKLTTEQYALIETAFQYWNDDRDMLHQQGYFDEEEWEEQEKILNDPNFPF
jgi:hypothetical protein